MTIRVWAGFVGPTPNDTEITISIPRIDIGIDVANTETQIRALASNSSK
ncbi:hypothetical protein PPL_00225 [Heterostelium album PN500]|uniref:Uncharacterized protein n=1 Tax=Heterostelium pallidum (strain ATCC 26659 / Pp 5 / PN500) TaxID=670386 RepID=D3AVW0_HETP5|nr:hypothetical protein PPL_00225 [Heterostelium album PN500]EFA86433.1 hypothetical protein PPL_00225 [Heterostelium album PN500]|eukprot:XP_020438538.1 hypothetical protein PPL_00225 [Heterostelium album PN500]